MGNFSILAIRIKELRKSLKMTQKEFSEFVGCTAATLSAYENVSKSPSLEIIKGIAEKCNISIDWLCGLSNKKRNNSIETYSDLYDYLFTIGEKTNLRFETVSYIGGYDEPITMHTQAIWFDNTQICNFMEEWQKMKTLHDDGSIDDDVYSLWMEKVLIKNQNTNERLEGKFIIPNDTELPFD